MKKFLFATSIVLLAAFSGCVGAPPSMSQSEVSIPHGVSPAVQTPPPGNWQFPFQTDPFDVPICASDPCSPKLDPNSATEVSGLMDGSFSLAEVQEAEPGTNGQGDADTDPTYFASKTDPAYTVTCSDFNGCSFLSGVSIHIPNGARASIDSDHHATVIELWAGAEFDFWEFNNGGSGQGTTNPVSGGGKLSVGNAAGCTTASLQNQGHCQGSGVEADVPLQPGLLDPRAIVAGNITHTVYVSIHCPSPDYVWPAAASNGTCQTGTEYGERIWLDLSDAKIDALSDYTWEKTLLHAMHDYGFMPVSRMGSGGGPWSFIGLDNATFTIVNETPAWNAFFTEVEDEGDGKNLDWGDNSSHLWLPTTGISQSNIHIVE